jgi:lycopene beta-cyclase
MTEGAVATVGPETVSAEWDVVLVGGGLANGLIAWRLRALRPELRVLVLEQGQTLGGRHTWSFCDSDLEPEVRAWLEPLIVYRWPGYSVAFPERTRHLGIGYASVTSERFHHVLAADLTGVRYGVGVAEVAPDRVSLADGEVLTAPLVVDGRGPAAADDLVLGWQKFVGVQFSTAAPHGLAEPILMDATVDQIDGYRFVYVLPLGPSRLLVEDTYYSDGPDLDQAQLRARIDAYAASHGWPLAEVEEIESGVLPIALAGDINRFWARAGATPRSGLRAALFHPTTGYSLPDAARLAARLAGTTDLTSAAVGPMVQHLSTSLWRQRAYFRLLNRMMFGAAEPGQRYRVLERFYGLSEGLIRRFYRGELTRRDQARLLMGQPPVPVRSALRCLSEQRFVRPGPAASGDRS